MNLTAMQLLKSDIREKAFQLYDDDRKHEFGDTEIEDHYQYDQAVLEYRDDFDIKVDLPCKVSIIGHNVCLVAKLIDDQWVCWPYWSSGDVERLDPSTLPWIQYAE